MTPVADPESQRQFIHRIHRIQGQLTGLQKGIEEARNIEQLITQARAIEKAVASLKVKVIDDHLRHQTLELWRDDPEQAGRTITRLFDLSHR